MAEAPDPPLEVFSDYVCPFCYLGKVALERYLAHAGPDAPPVAWRFFDLRGGQRRPDGSLLPDAAVGKDEAYFERAIVGVQRLAREFDAPMTLDVARGVDSWNAQRATLHVLQAHGDAAFARFHGAVFEALWTRGRDIGDPDVLAEVAAEVRAAALDQDLDEALRERFAASKALGVTGIPTFVYRGFGVPGAVPPEMLARLVAHGRSVAEQGAAARS